MIKEGTWIILLKYVMKWNTLDYTGLNKIEDKLGNYQGGKK